ncbi:hypothetical protein KCP75_13085 [Salmonella enterica subsp. enterica]|nr:hypothetical protein KCP75_13085 [Salmonella enterica subsp. enterica]
MLIRKIDAHAPGCGRAGRFYAYSESDVCRALLRRLLNIFTLPALKISKLYTHRHRRWKTAMRSTVPQYFAIDNPDAARSFSCFSGAGFADDSEDDNTARVSADLPGTCDLSAGD